jgi:hypothetical protein
MTTQCDPGKPTAADLTGEQFSGLMILLDEHPGISIDQYRERHGLTDDELWAAACQRLYDDREAAREELLEQRFPAAEARYRELLDRYYAGTEYSGDVPPVYKAPASQRQPRPDCYGHCDDPSQWREDWPGPECGHDGKDAPERVESIRQLALDQQYDKPDVLEPLVGFLASDWHDELTLRKEVEREDPSDPNSPVIRVTTAATTPDGRTFEPKPDQPARVELLVKQAAGQHRAGLHDTGSHPFCPECHLRQERSTWLNSDLNNAGRSDVAILREAQSTLFGRAFAVMLRNGWRAPTFEPRLPVEDGNPWVSLSDLLDQEPPGYLFDGVVPEAGIGILRGRDGVYKTFVALDLAMHLVTDETTWHGRDVAEDYDAEVVFVAGEGARSFGKRISAWLTERQTGDPADDAETFREADKRLHVRSGSVNLYAGGPAYDDLLSLVGQRKPALVVVDTLQTNSTGAEGNSASDMGRVMSRLYALRDASGGTVLVLAHTGKSDQDTRGSSSIEDDADFVMHLAADGYNLSLAVTKQKDGDSDFTIPLKAVPAHGSVVIGAGQPEPEWASDNLANRIRGVLYAVREGDEPTQAQVLAMVKDDGTGKPAGRTQVYAALGDLEREGAVIGTKVGSKAKTYRLDLSQYPAEATAATS